MFPHLLWLDFEGGVEEFFSCWREWGNECRKDILSRKNVDVELSSIKECGVFEKLCVCEGKS